MYRPSEPERGLSYLKISSTPQDPSLAVLRGIAKLSGGEQAAQVHHATTIATNALLEKSGGRVAFVTSLGFKDLLWLGRGQRSSLYALAPSRVEPPLEPQHAFEIDERIDAQAQVVQALEEKEKSRLLDSLPQGLDAIAICLLHSSLNPEHEKGLAASLEKAGFKTFCSHLVAPGSGEYERGMTTVLAAFLSSKVESYLEKLEGALKESHLMIVHSAGGLLTVREAQQAPHRLALSGPAAGLRGALAVGALCSHDNLVTLDMGGTSTDVALLAAGELPYRWQTSVEEYPLRAPTLDIHTIGAGGGSIAHADPSGLLAVGPQSAGADPGPACYGRGGTRATVTDALCWNGFLPSTLGDEALELDREAAGRVLRALGESLNLSTDETADGILELTTAHLVEAVRKVTTGQGQDPASFTLFPFGGAGPLMACMVADGLLMDTILVPSCAGLLSAWGALAAPWEREWSQTIPPPERRDPKRLERVVQALRETAEKELQAAEEIDWTPLFAKRYCGQGETLTMAPETDFHQCHQQRFGFSRTQLEVETVEVRLRARKKPLPGFLETSKSGPPRPLPSVSLRWAGALHQTPVLAHRGHLPETLCGPLVLQQSGATLFVAPGWQIEALRGGHLLMTKRQHERG